MPAKGISEDTLILYPALPTCSQYSIPQITVPLFFERYTKDDIFRMAHIPQKSDLPCFR